MRRKDREITDRCEIGNILSKNHVIRLGFYDEGAGHPYIVPLSYAYSYDQVSGALAFYLHCAEEGRKITLMKKNNRICFEIDEVIGIKKGEASCDYGMHYTSIIGVGKLYKIPEDDLGEKKRALDLIMKHHGASGNLKYSPEIVRRTTVLKLEVESFTAKGCLP